MYFQKAGGYSPMLLSCLIIKLQNLILIAFLNNEEEVRT